MRSRRRLLDDRVATLILFPDTGTRVWDAIVQEALGRRGTPPRRAEVNVTDMESALREA